VSSWRTFDGISVIVFSIRVGLSAHARRACRTSPVGLASCGNHAKIIDCFFACIGFPPKGFLKND